MKMLLHLCRHRALLRLKFPAVMLVALLQRTPIVRVAAVAENYVASSPLGWVLRSAATLFGSLGVFNL